MENKECLYINPSEVIYLSKANISTRTISFQPVLTLPNFLFVNESMEFLCGPLVMLMKELAIKKGIGLQYIPHPNNKGDLARIFLTYGVPDIFLMDFDSANFYHYEKLSREDYGLNITHTISIDYNEFGNIAYLKETEPQPMFTFFQCFTQSLWIFLIIMTIIFAYLLSYKNFTYQLYLKNLWNIYILYLSKSISKELDLSGRMSKIIMGSWLTIELLLTILFCSFLLDYMIKPIPIRVIDSWHDLYLRKDVKILASETNALTKFTELENTSMALNFRSRLTKLSPDTDEYFRKDMLDKIRTGHFAYVTNRLILIQNLFLLINSSEYLNKFHISKDGGGELPYFLAAQSSIDQDILDELNKIILYIRESGLYSVWVDLVLKFVGNIHLLDGSSDNSITKFEEISLKYMYDVLYLFIIGIISATVILILENLVKNYKGLGILQKQHG